MRRVLLLLVVALADLASAQALCLDPAFAGGGITTVDVRQVANVGWTPQGLDVQPDGRIVIGGMGGNLDGGSFFAMRLTEDGDVDPSFGVGGFVEIPLSVPGPEFETIRVQADGTLVLAGTGEDTAVAAAERSRVVIARLTSTGVLEQLLLPRFTPTPQVVNGQVALPDGRALFAGQGRTRGTDYNLLVFSLLRDGGLDTSYGDGGLVEVDFSGGDEFGGAIVLEAQGRVLVPGLTYRNQFDFGLARLTPQGQFDTTFGAGTPTSGRLATDFFGRHDSCDVAAAQADGKPLCAGTVTLADGGTATAVVRFRTNGEVDATFGLNGVVLKSRSRASLRGLAVHPNGTIAMAGHAPGPDGGLDMTIDALDPFGRTISLGPADGTLRLDLGGDEGAHQLRFDSQNRLLVFGETSVDGGQNDVMVARYIFCGADGGIPDAGTTDAGTTDAGTTDAGTTDAGTPDAGTPDAGTPDGGASSHSLKVGCSCDASGGLAWLSLLLLAGLRRRVR